MQSTLFSQKKPLHMTRTIARLYASLSLSFEQRARVPRDEASFKYAIDIVQSHTSTDRAPLCSRTFRGFSGHVISETSGAGIFIYQGHLTELGRNDDG
ncbi:hypothetical protein SERLA73DRAFT_184400 [Serpula lacrymans var. lacrymans S7.3]|uniref:Uncharacterized protein n=2 Tax=Serpula lacrymans var. lacrymans TaxID=341189 RepID=F8Q358_SERL3|nr:uncharacterized protein SERLADRAFT_472079 [Serpula lacrymans var. lacrymans S7.9]EGN97619.1 hypothetical protein SERLA73DRAFT_184400 [Serpula lacrymans var. lacrymans S7.3]EGO23211.1 hypothetical protein SERLADRAFT_472079 [Serpula lacrymans var. lacrymans S7.9]